MRMRLSCLFLFLLVLGKRTLHGVSAIIARRNREHKMATLTTVAEEDAEADDGSSLSSRRTPTKQKCEMAEVLAHKGHEVVEEEMIAVREDLGLHGLDFDVLYSRVMRKRRFFAVVVLFQLFAAYPVYVYGGWHDSSPNIVETPTTSFADSAANGAHFSNVSLFLLPRHSVWAYIPPEHAYAIDEDLQAEYELLVLQDMLDGGLNGTREREESCEVGGFEVVRARAQAQLGSCEHIWQLYLECLATRGSEWQRCVRDGTASTVNITNTTHLDWWSECLV